MEMEWSRRKTHFGTKYVVDMTLESGGLRFPIGNMLAKRRRRRGCLEAHNNSMPSVQAVVCQFWPPLLKGIQFNLGKRILSAPSLSSSSEILSSPAPSLSLHPFPRQLNPWLFHVHLTDQQERLAT